MNKKPFAAAASQNRQVILEVLRKEFSHSKNVLEIGSGTGQHAAYFSKQLPNLTWQASDKEEMIAGISMWLKDTASTPPAIILDVNKEWPNIKFDAAFGANIAHIFHWDEIEAMFAGLDSVLTENSVFCLYGPFNRHGDYTSESNKRFDTWLKSRDPLSCIRDLDDLTGLAEKYNFYKANEYQMPENNMIICWKK